MAPYNRHMARFEKSAGFIVFVDPDKSHPEREFLLLDYGKFWDYAKGHVEKGEDDLTAARREVEEETGITEIDVIPGFAHKIEYFFRQKAKGLIHKQVTFFLARAKSRKVTISHEHAGYEFLPAEAAVERVTYPSSRQVLKEAIAFLVQSTK